MGTVNTSSSLNVAIVGGGIIGVITALGLLRRGIPVTIYERASDWHEIGAGFAFTGLARECMKRLDPRIVEELIGVSEEWSPTRFWDGFHPRTKQEAEQDETAMLWQIPQENLLYRACVRSHLLFRMTALLPEGVTVFGKQLVDYEDNDENDKVILNFADGSTAKADVVIGCDGIHSATREVLLGGGDHPVPRPTFTHMVAYRTMVPMAAAITVLGEKKARSTCMHCGPKANVMSYPVINGTFLNIAIFIYEPGKFPNPDKMTAPGTRADIEHALQGWGPHITEIVKLFAEEQVKWGSFDMLEQPAPTYARGRVCIAGDAAHASTPFQGVGACMGVEDALVLCELLDTVQTRVRDGSLGQTSKLAVEKALQAYSESRMPRSQWQVRSSRAMGEMYQWRHEETGRDGEKCRIKLEESIRKVWDFDVDNMIAEAKSQAEM